MKKVRFTKLCSVRVGQGTAERFHEGQEVVLPNWLADRMEGEGKAQIVDADAKSPFKVPNDTDEAPAWAGTGG